MVNIDKIINKVFDEGISYIKCEEKIGVFFACSYNLKV